MTYRGKRWMLAWVCGIGCGLTVGAMPVAMAQGQTPKTKAPAAGKAPTKSGGTPKASGSAKQFDDDGAIGEPGVAPANAGKAKAQRPAGNTPNGTRPGRPTQGEESDEAPTRPDSQKMGQQKPGQQRPGTERPGTAGGPKRAPDPNAIIPCPFKLLTRAQQEELDELLGKWEEKSSTIERFQCTLDRYEYDQVFGPADPEEWKTYGTGDLKYAAPDKGLFKITPVQEWKKDKPVSKGDHWVCDGKSVFQFDYQQKVLKKFPLPPENQGKKIVDGPLPFLFGAKAETLKQRYWLRIITPEDVKGQQYWLEAWPKYGGDRQNFLKVLVILSATEFLPDAMQVCDPGYRDKTNEKRTTYVFKDRKINWGDSPLTKLNLFHKEFYEPKTPFGWTLKVEDFAPPEAETVQRPQPPVEPNAAKKKKG